METRCHVHEELIAASPEAVFRALITPSAIRRSRGFTGSSREPAGTPPSELPATGGHTSSYDKHQLRVREQS
jgi:hypothetical protein